MTIGEIGEEAPALLPRPLPEGAHLDALDTESGENVTDVVAKSW